MTGAVKRPTGREEILDAVLDAAERLFAAAGPNEVSLRTIAGEAGVNYGLVHRHFGTKDELFERLLERYARRWEFRDRSGESHEEALLALLGPAPVPGAYLRLLAWTLLSERPGTVTDAHRRHTTLDRLPALRGGEDAEVVTAAALALVFGWRFFSPFIRAALHLEDADDDDLQEAMRRHLHRLLEDDAGLSARPADPPPPTR